MFSKCSSLGSSSASAYTHIDLHVSVNIGLCTSLAQRCRRAFPCCFGNTLHLVSQVVVDAQMHMSDFSVPIGYLPILNTYLIPVRNV